MSTASPAATIVRAFQPRYLFQIASVFVASAAILVLAFDPWAMLAAFLMAMLTGYSLGIFHHMLLSHRSFRAVPALENLGSLLGTLSWRGPMAAPIRYAAMHRIHHAASDQEADPHSPAHGIWHGFMGWMWRFEERFNQPAAYEKLVPRLAKRPFLRLLDRHVDLLQLAYGIAVFLIASGIAATLGQPNFWTVGAKYAMYLVFVKTAFVLVLANAVDIVNHSIGYRNYETGDLSTNSALMGIVHLGGAISWHNNHHAKPKYFSVRKNWWEIDVHYQIVRSLSFFGLTSDIKVLDDRSPNTRTLADLHHRSAKQTTLLICSRLALWMVSLTGLIWAMSQSWPGIAAVGIPLLLAAAVALQNLGLVGHEGTHYNLAKRRLFSVRLGNMVSALVPLHMNIGFAISHSAHHRYANTNRDPDVVLFSPYQGFWRRVLLARGAAARSYWRKTWSLATGEITAEDRAALAFDDTTLVKLARENLVFVAVALVLYAALGVLLGQPAWLAMTLAFGSAALFSGLRPYLEHADTDTNRDSVARTFASPRLDWLFGGINYHDAHHRYPGVPVYRIKELQHFLVQKGEAGSSNVDSLGELFQLLNYAPYGRTISVSSAVSSNDKLPFAFDKEAIHA